MRVALFAKQKPNTQTTACLLEAFQREGHQVIWLHPHRPRWIVTEGGRILWNHGRLRAFRPDLIFVYSKDIQIGTLRAWHGRVPIALWYEDWTDPIHPELVERAPWITHFFTTARGMLPCFVATGFRRAYFQPGGCCDVHHQRVSDRDVPEKLRSEVAFIGKPSPTDRVALLKAVAGRFRLLCHGRGWADHGLPQGLLRVEPKDYARICAAAAIIIGYDATDEVDGYFSNRAWLTLGCGGFLLTRSVPGIQEFFTEGRELATFRDTGECLSRIAHYLPLPEERKRISDAGYGHVHERRTYRHLVREILAKVEEAP